MVAQNLFAVFWLKLSGIIITRLLHSRLLVHLDVEDCSEELLRQQSYAIKNQLVAFKAHRGYFACSSLVLYGIRIVGFHARKGPIIGALMP